MSAETVRKLYPETYREIMMVAINLYRQEVAKKKAIKK
jgi:hypothetical protein